MPVDDDLTVVDTDREELRRCIAEARDRFDAVARAADPGARARGADWDARQIAVHVLTVAMRYAAAADGTGFRRAAAPRDLDEINATELEAQLAGVTHLGTVVERRRALDPVIDEFLDRLAATGEPMPFHSGTTLSSTAAQANWLAELLLHGTDLAAAAGVPWRRPERSMAVVVQLVVEGAPAYLRDDVDPSLRMCVEMRSPGVRPWVMVLESGAVTVRLRRPEDRPDAVLRAPASVVVDLLYQRIGPLRAMTRGLLVVGGRRPWVSLRLQRLFETI